ncbi:MAG: DUF2877 domain-containing protein [Chloroflexota bacterium]
MNSIKAISLTSAVHDWQTNTRQPRILHIFDRAWNLINENGEILSIVAPEIGNGPFNLVVESDLLFVEHLSVESAVSVSANDITLGSLNISTAKAKLWNAKLDWDSLHSARDNISSQVKKLPITNYLEHGGFDTSLGGHSGLLNHQHLPTLQFSNSLPASVANADLPSSLLAAKGLAGLGQGLTPSGDDFLMGALHAAWIIHPQEVASGLAQGVAESAAPLTTSLSAAWIRSAGRGEAGELWHQFFDSLILGDEFEIQKTMNKILAVGETSGADALAGFVGVFQSWKIVDSSVS